MPNSYNFTFKPVPGFDLNDVKRITTTINIGRPEDITPKEAESAVSQLSVYHFQWPYKMTGQDFPMWRIRTNDYVLQQFKKTKELGYPPQSNKIGSGRANAEGETMFYAASSPFTASMETRLTAGKAFHLTEFEVNEGGTLNVGMIGELDRYWRTGRTLTENKTYTDQYDKFFEMLKQKNQEELIECFAIIDAFYASWLEKKGKENYIMTAAITRQLFQDKSFDALCYPSVLDDNGVSIVIQPAAYDDLIKPIATSIYLAGECGADKQWNMLPLVKAEGIQSNGVIIWPKEAEVITREKLHQESIELQ
jgi:hypothetical protein